MANVSSGGPAKQPISSRRPDLSEPSYSIAAEILHSSHGVMGWTCSRLLARRCAGLDLALHYRALRSSKLAFLGGATPGNWELFPTIRIPNSRLRLGLAEQEACRPSIRSINPSQVESLPVVG